MKRKSRKSKVVRTRIEIDIVNGLWRSLCALENSLMEESAMPKGADSLTRIPASTSRSMLYRVDRGEVGWSKKDLS